MTLICAAGLVVQAVFLLTFVASGYQNNILATCLLMAVEALPCCVVVARFAPLRRRRRAASSNW